MNNPDAFTLSFVLLAAVIHHGLGRIADAIRNSRPQVHVNHIHTEKESVE